MGARHPLGVLRQESPLSSPPPDAEAFVRWLAPAVRQAASIARALEGRVANRPKHGEATPVKAAMTIADSACQEALLVPLAEHFSQVRLEAEEDTPSIGRFSGESQARVVIDPIDGTLRFYLEGRGPYAVMVGLAVEDEYAAALVALPREGVFLDAVRGHGAHTAMGNARRRTARFDPAGHRVLVSHDLPGPARRVLREAGLEVVPASGGAISVAPLLPGVRAGLRLASGSPEGVSIRGRIGALIASEAGALVHCEKGGPFPRRIDEPAQALLVAAGEADLRVLRAALEAALAA